MDEDVLFDELVVTIEAQCFSGHLPQLSLPRLISIIVTSVLVCIPCVAEAEPHVKDYFANRLALALARRLSTVERREWLN